MNRARNPIPRLTIPGRHGEPNTIIASSCSILWPCGLERGLASDDERRRAHGIAPGDADVAIVGAAAVRGAVHPIS